LAVLRLALGCHFLYEGVWKITHAEQFVGETEGFLSGARGPLAGVFYKFIPDIDGHQRLESNLSKDDSVEIELTGKPAKVCKLKLAKTWDDLRQKFVDYYRPKAVTDDSQKLYDQLTKDAKKVSDRHIRGLMDFLEENDRENEKKIKAHFESLKRFEEGRKTDPNTTFQTQRRWDEMQDLRKEAKGLMAELDSRENALKAELLNLLNKDRKPETDAVLAAEKKAAAAKKLADAEMKKAEPGPAAAKPAKTEKPAAKSLPATETAEVSMVVVDLSPLAEGHAELGPFAASSNPFQWKRVEQLAFLLTWSLFAIGVCLVLGLFTRPAALAGAGFMLFVVMSQPSYPFVIPADPPQLGHALLINKDFVEMVALLMIASTCLGRWTGLDFFIHKYLIKPFCRNGGDDSIDTPSEGRYA
jgi:uncharacterized membrane protein YphA (DoxX/SURF4 family)